jgi:hypothetical protein
MSRYAFFLWIVFLGLAVFTTLACGSHALQSITISPTSADAQDYPNGQVQFVATGYFKTDPLIVTPLPANWNALEQSLSPTSAVSVTSTGLAQCADGALGTYLVEASDPMPLEPGAYNCPFLGCVIEATAKLTCP